VLRLSPAATSHLIDRLFGARLVARTEDPDDRRHKRVAITTAGRNLIERVQEERSAEVTRVIARLSTDLQRQFVRVLTRVVSELAALPEPTRPE
jgi:DNA-binding MarR family transcriptional regulator